MLGDEGSGEWEVTDNGHRVYLGGWWKSSRINGDGCIICELLKPTQSCALNSEFYGMLIIPQYKTQNAILKKTMKK